MTRRFRCISFGGQMDEYLIEWNGHYTAVLYHTTRPPNLLQLDSDRVQQHIDSGYWVEDLEWVDLQVEEGL